MRRGFPLAYSGMRIGLMGGSFDPAHGGHRHLAEEMLKRLRLDRVWWLVTPQNPLKPQASPLSKRVASACAAARGPRHVVSDLESRLGVTFTIDTIRALQRRYPGVFFVLLLGGDNLSSFNRWRRWPEVVRAAPIAILSRPGHGVRALRASAFTRFAGQRIAPADATALPELAAPAWVYLTAPLDPRSSTALRAKRP